MKKKTSERSASFKVGAIALAFLILGYQIALFVHRAAVATLVSHRDKPDTVYIIAPDTVSLTANSSVIPQGQRKSIRREAAHSPAAKAIVAKASPRQVESFPFDPNTVSISDLQRLGFSEKQAQSIDNYRLKGGRFHRASDFAKSFVVSDSVFERLSTFITIPTLDINQADSAALDNLPGIGGYFASRIIAYREQLGGFSYPEQLMDIYNFDKAKYEALSDLIYVGPHESLKLWELSEDELAMHPYIGKYAAHGIILFKKGNPHSDWSVDNLVKAGVLKKDMGDKLMRCSINAP